MKRALTGIRTSGSVHLGNFLGMIKPALEFQATHECFFFLADMHALTTEKNPDNLRKQVMDTVACWIAAGLDYKKHVLYRSSDIPQVTELSWYLSCVTGYGFLEKAHAFKDALQNNRDVNHGVFSYPVLMAADILLYDADAIPVGKDQKQHVEFARDMAGSFNALYGNILKLPEPVIKEEVMIIPGLDGRKMSKSYDNVIPMFASDKEINKRIMAIATDSTALEAPKSLKDSLLGTIMNAFLPASEVQDFEARLNKGGLGWGHVKAEFAQKILSQLEDVRKTFAEIRSDEQMLTNVLSEGAEKARAVALPKLAEIRKAVGIA